MKTFIYFLLLGSVLSFNLNNLSKISRKEILNGFAKFAFLPIVAKKNNIDSIQNSVEIFRNGIMEKDEELINTIDNNIYFYSPITKTSCFKLEKELLFINQKNLLEGSNNPINLHIQSNGGNLFNSIYIIDLIKNLETPVYTYIDGFAASAATLISVVGKKRFMTSNSLMLIHQLSGGMNGKFSEMEDENENINGLMDFIIRTYLENTKINKDELEQILKRDIWLNSTYCLQNGLVDEIL
jgi:ATP-dependent protease ClpP protease subunit